MPRGLPAGPVQGQANPARRSAPPGPASQNAQGPSLMLQARVPLGHLPLPCGCGSRGLPRTPPEVPELPAHPPVLPAQLPPRRPACSYTTPGHFCSGPPPKRGVPARSDHRPARERAAAGRVDRSVYYHVDTDTRARADFTLTPGGAALAQPTARPVPSATGGNSEPSNEARDLGVSSL